MRDDSPLWFFTCLLSVRLLFIGSTRRTRSDRWLVAVVVAMGLLAHFAFAPGLPRLPWNLDVALMALVFHVAVVLALLQIALGLPACVLLMCWAPGLIRQRRPC